ncbi:MAG TPA: undecaprenyldiphospho-muramoylpentapeptide beta-N-acetylglucosaminyltransferase [Candidatus Coprenecus pullistercoris]|nr:undecaprenyldiphospho-muramoylpentapeptide beta-N-acetylglucosaminyltransferase [Candidatus Coprenecus pullistercoris]
MSYRIIISGGGTGGHIFPALSIAGALRKAAPDTEILFVGAKGKMEMERVPAAGYRIIGLPVAGLQRRLTLSNLSVPFKVMGSLIKAGRIIRDFRPDAVVGVGGYASAPMLRKAQGRGIPTLIQEQNSFAGLTNKILGKKARRICVAYDGMERFFPADKIILTGNPIRDNIRPYTAEERAAGLKMYGLSPELPTVLIVGGSGGCGTFNSVMAKACRESFCNFPFQVIWQSGKGYRTQVEEVFSSLEGASESEGLRRCGNVRNCDFISRMDMAFAAADLVVSRAGAGTISELCAIGKATIFVPSPNVTEDHQTHNAMALVEKDAAVMVTDTRASADLLPAIVELLEQPAKIKELEDNILRLARPDAADVIASEIIKLIEETRR